MCEIRPYYILGYTLLGHTTLNFPLSRSRKGNFYHGDFCFVPTGLSGLGLTTEPVGAGDNQMSLFKIFSGKGPEVYEQKGDAYCNDELWGNAKMEYERALSRLEKAQPLDRDSASRLQEKISRTREALALMHKSDAEELMAGGYHGEARDLLALAVELTADLNLEKELQKKILETDRHTSKKVELTGFLNGTDEDTDGMDISDDDENEYFFTLCATLPEEVQMAYMGYGQNFKTGYLALNDGDFETASEYLSLALEENREYDTYIPLELATAYLNLEKHEEARQLLESLLVSHPDTLPAFQLLCEIFWETGDFDRAQTLLASIPEELKASVAVALLQGETLYQSENYQEARSFFIHFLETYGWNESVARALAKTHETMGELDDARNIYQEIMESCHSCNARIDPRVKEKYADLCFASGVKDTKILELYLSLAQEIPDNASVYYEKVSRIYAAQGNQTEATRFRTFSEKLVKETLQNR